jgi:peroxiredoxin
MRRLSALAVATLLLATELGVTTPDAASAAVARACKPAVDGDSATPGDAAPTFTLPTLDHGCVRLAALRGSPVVVNFWASWCRNCRREFPALRAAYAKQHEAAGLEIVGVASSDIRSDSRRFARQQHANWILASDDDEIVANAYLVKPIPQTIFIRPDGTVSAHIYGEVSKKDLAAELRKIIPTHATPTT